MALFGYIRGIDGHSAEDDLCPPGRFRWSKKVLSRGHRTVRPGRCGNWFGKDDPHEGKEGAIVGRLEALVDGSLISYSIINEAPLPLDRYHSVISLLDEGAGCKIRGAATGSRRDRRSRKYGS